VNHLEKRLRAALDARAETFEASPHAWARVQSRRPRRRRGRLLLAALPVALLAAFVPALLNGGLGRNTAADTDAIYQRLMRERTATGEQLTVDDPAEGRPLRIWFAKARPGYPEVCFIVERVAGEPYGGCSPVSDRYDVQFAGSSLRDGAATAMDWGVAEDDVGTVTGVTKAGHKIPGTLLSPDGAPYRVWTVTYPAEDAMTSVEYAGQNGGQGGQLSRDMLAQPLGSPAGAPMELPDGVIARPYQAKEGTELHWTRHGAYLGGGLPTTREAPVSVSVTEDVITGFARSDVARVEVSFPGGATTSLETRPDPWNLGVVLFAGATDGDRFQGYRALAYDAAGKEVWRHETPAVGMPEPGGELIGQVMALPGTEESGVPVRLYFTKGPDGAPTFCNSGGITPESRGVTSCSFGQQRKAFRVQSVTTYLPEPGAVIHFGPAGDDWEWVEAVLSDGRRVRAEFFRGDGAPQRVWHVAVPLDAEVGGYVMKARDAAAKPIPERDKACGRQATGSDAGRLTLDTGVTALLSGNCVAFWENGEMGVALPGPVPGWKLSDLLDAERPAYWAGAGHAWYGYAPAGTAKVEITMKGGATATARAVPDPWGQGVTVFAGPKPAGGYWGPAATLTGYGADGKELWRYEG
jgi:hypothetical protein